MLGDGGSGAADAGLERCSRLKTLLARHQDNQVEARPGLAAEASFDDSAEGERLHRYQERWHRSLLRTLAEIEELRDRGPLNHQEAELSVGPDSEPVIPIMEEVRLEPAVGGRSPLLRGSPPTMPVLVGGVPTPQSGSYPRPRSSGCACSASEAHPVKQTERGQDGVAAGDQSIRHQENCQNKPTEGRSTVVGQGPRARKLVESHARSALRTYRESHDPASARRPAASQEENAHSDSHANSTVATRPRPGGGGPAPDRHRGQLQSGRLDSPPGRI